MERDKALIIATDILNSIKEYCEVIEIAGSIRRGMQHVGDIELVCVPKETRRSSLGMKLMERGRVTSGKFGGRSVKMVLTEGIQLDFFMPQANDFYRILAIRTGSAHFSHHTIATGWNKKGWVGTEDGLRLKTECVRKTDKSPWVCTSPNPTLPPIFNSEREFFAWINVPYVEPKDRN